ncbi:MAG TPA: hypothetical protein DDZ88_17805 [Verrucomicrobiales bacterium]|nr:hypothetical protein [Verrucomicrobiales bacterium]
MPEGGGIGLAGRAGGGEGAVGSAAAGGCTPGGAVGRMRGGTGGVWAWVNPQTRLRMVAQMRLGWWMDFMSGGSLLDRRNVVNWCDHPAAHWHRCRAGDLRDLRRVGNARASSWSSSGNGKIHAARCIGCKGRDRRANVGGALGDILVEGGGWHDALKRWRHPGGAGAGRETIARRLLRRCGNAQVLRRLSRHLRTRQSRGLSRLLRCLRAALWRSGGRGRGHLLEVAVVVVNLGGFGAERDLDDGVLAGRCALHVVQQHAILSRLSELEAESLVGLDVDDGDRGIGRVSGDAGDGQVFGKGGVFHDHRGGFEREGIPAPAGLVPVHRISLGRGEDSGVLLRQSRATGQQVKAKDGGQTCHEPASPFFS